MPSRTRRKILELMLFSPEKEFYLREISRKIDENTNSVGRELNQLLEASLILKNNKEKLIFYRINKNSPVFSTLKELFLRTESLGNHLREILSKTENIKLALIFGSFAKGEETEKSDIDLLIVGNIRNDKLIRKIREIENHLGREINYILWSEEEYQKRKKTQDSFLKTILTEPKIILIGEI